MFNALQTLVELDGAAVLDLYAGTGAVGLEALSRGAALATLVESDRAAAAVGVAGVSQSRSSRRVGTPAMSELSHPFPSLPSSVQK